MSKTKADEFIINVKKSIDELIQDRLKRKKPPEGYRYKRDWFDRFGKELTVDYVLNNMEAIDNKTSNLNAERRKVVSTIYKNAILMINVKEDKDEKSI